MKTRMHASPLSLHIMDHPQAAPRGSPQPRLKLTRLRGHRRCKNEALQEDRNGTKRLKRTSECTSKAITDEERKGGDDVLTKCRRACNWEQWSMQRNAPSAASRPPQPYHMLGLFRHWCQPTWMRDPKLNRIPAPFPSSTFYHSHAHPERHGGAVYYRNVGGRAKIPNRRLEPKWLRPVS